MTKDHAEKILTELASRLEAGEEASEHDLATLNFILGSARSFGYQKQSTERVRSFKLGALGVQRAWSSAKDGTACIVAHTVDCRKEPGRDPVCETRCLHLARISF